MWTFPVHQEQREMAAMKLGKEHFFKSFPSGFFFFNPFSLGSFCTTVSAKMSLLMYCCLIYKLILLSSESEWKTGTCHRNALWNILETSIYSNTRCSDKRFTFVSSSNTMLQLPFPPPHFPIWLFTCRCVSSKSAFYLRTSQFLRFHCTTSTECMMVAWSTLKCCE